MGRFSGAGQDSFTPIEKEKVSVSLETSVEISDIWMEVSSIWRVYLNLVINALDAMECVEEEKIQIRFGG